MLLTDIFGRSFMDDFFEDFANSSFYRPNRIGSAPAMKADVQELDNAYQIDLELPGFQKEDLHAELKDGYLTIKATHQNTEEQKDAKGRYIRQERYTGHYQRSFYVGDDITQEDVHAAFENGVLKLSVPNPEYPVHRRGQLHIVGDHQHRLLIMSGCLQKQIHHILAASGIQISGRFVRQNQHGPCNHGPANGNPLLLPAG